jgi:hypothetical protein
MAIDNEAKEKCMTQYMAAPATDGAQASIPRRVGTRSMLPSTWINREVTVDRTDAAGKSATTTAVLCDWCPFGPIVRTGSDRLIIAWEKISLIELTSD